MAFSNKLKADYIELINKQLDSIVIISVDDFDTLSVMLSRIASDNMDCASYDAEPARAYQESMQHIKSFLDEPESSVENRADDEEYKDIIRARIRAKADEFQMLSASQKYAYIANQQRRRADAELHQVHMSQYQPPEKGSEAHTSPNESAWLDGFQNHEPHQGPENTTDEGLALTFMGPRAHRSTLHLEFSEEMTSDEMIRVLEVLPASVSRIYFSDVLVTTSTTLQALGFTEADVDDMSLEKKYSIMQPGCVQALSNGTTSIEQLKSMSAEAIDEAIETGTFPWFDSGMGSTSVP